MPDARMTETDYGTVPLYVFRDALPPASAQVAQHAPYMYAVTRYGQHKPWLMVATWGEVLRVFGAHTDANQVYVFALDGEAIALACVVRVK